MKREPYPWKKPKAQGLRDRTPRGLKLPTLPESPETQIKSTLWLWVSRAEIGVSHSPSKCVTKQSSHKKGQIKRQKNNLACALMMNRELSESFMNIMGWKKPHSSSQFITRFIYWCVISRQIFSWHFPGVLFVRRQSSVWLGVGFKEDTSLFFVL